MKKRTKLSDRILPNYTRGEEIMNMVTHIVGGALGVTAVTLCVIFAALKGNVYGVVGSAIFGGFMIATYTLSSVYHGLLPGSGKKVLQILDHCMIYTLIAGSYTVVALSALLTGLGIFDDIAKHAGAGTLVPITGFANAVAAPAVEFQTEGFILGVGAKMFTIAGPVIVYGVSASVVYGLIYWITTLF